MGAQFSQDEETQSSNPTAITTQVKQQNQNQEHKIVAPQSPHKNHEENPKKANMPPNTGISSRANGMKTEVTQVKLQNQNQEHKTVAPQSPHKNHEEHSKKTTMTPNTGINYRANGMKTEVKLPHNYEAIIKNSDSAIDRSSAEKICEQLQTGVFLDQKRKKYWVEKRTNSNCFMIYAKDLLITWAEDARYWWWNDLKETRDESISVAELLSVCWLEVHGTFRIEKLTPGLIYEVVFLVMMKDISYGWEVPVKVRLVLPDGKSQEREENLKEKPKGQWIEIPVGEFKTSTENTGDVQFSLYEYKGGLWKRGLIIKGVALRPKI